MVTQEQLRELVRLQELAKNTKARVEGLREALVKASKANEEVEKGSFALVVKWIVDPSTSWKGIVDRIIEKHPTLAGAIKAIVKSYTKPGGYDKVEIKPTAG